MEYKRGRLEVRASSTVCGKKCSILPALNLFLGKAAQVTVFIIIGIIILFTFAGVLIVTKTATKEKLFTAGEPLISRVPEAFVPVQLYTENCLRQVSKQGLLILGQQGGYSYPEVLGEYSLSYPTDSVGVNLEPTKVPYWFYNQQRNEDDKVVYASHQPKLTGNDQLSMEKQLERYAEEHLDACLNDYALLEQQGFSISLEPAKTVDVAIKDKAVGFTLKMPLEAAYAGTNTEMDTFFVSIQLPLQHYYEIAELIKKTQETNHFLEKQGLELLTAYSRKDLASFAPTSDLTFDFFSALSWSETALKQKYQQVLSSYVPLLRFLGSNNFYYSQFPSGGVLSQKVLDNMVLPLAGAEDLSVRFDYLNWEPYFKTNSYRDVIKPNSQFVSYSFLQFGMQQYETHYDISYPVLVAITDPTALDGQGYNFVFALEANIRNNQPGVNEQVREAYPRSLTPLACEEAQRGTELIKTVVVDSFTKEPLEAVRIGFSIPEQAECDIGLTNEFGAVEEKYPAVYGGEINFIKPGYLTNFYPIDTYKTKDTPLLLGSAVAGAVAAERVIELDQQKTISLKVKKKLLRKCITPLECRYTTGGAGIVIPYHDISCEAGVQQCFFNQGGFLLPGTPAISVVANNSLIPFNDYYFTNQAIDLDSNENVILTLERVSGFNPPTRQADYTASAVVNGGQSASLNLYPGIYQVTAMVTDNRQLIIPSEERCFQYNILTWETEECTTLEQMQLGSFMSGRLQWDTTATYLTITPEDLYNSQNLTVFLPVQDLLGTPLTTTIPQQECGSFVCLPGAGCAFEICDQITATVPARVIEDLQVGPLIGNLSADPQYRRLLEPQWH